MKTVRMLVMLGAAVIGLVACQGSGGSTTTNNNQSCATPALNATGTWCVTLASTNNTCGNPLDTTPYYTVSTQSGNNISTTTEFGTTFSGTICGSNAVMTGTSNGFNTTVYFAFQTSSSATGTVTYSNNTCSGTDTFSAVTGTCP